ncbi:MAG: ribE [Clostridia bacterium]|nr:ribE [Clostridia bacterium]
MFTGLVEEVGVVESVVKGPQSAKMTIRAKEVLSEVNLGDSISTNGVCLTVKGFTAHSFQVDIMGETMRSSGLNLLAVGDTVNLERALRLGDRLGGHLVSGHIDGTGVIKDYKKEDHAVWITIATKPQLLRYIVRKGSIAIDGISLTVASVDEQIFKVSIIPHTKEVTTLLHKKIGAVVNLECDMVAKYIEKLCGCTSEIIEKKDIDMNFLREHGFASF